MFAHKLAWQAGIVNVEAMRDRMSVETFDAWAEAYGTGRLDDGWEQAAMIACEIRNLPAMISAKVMGGKLKVEDLALPSDFMPKQPGAKTKKRKSDGISSLANRLAAKFGKQ